MDRSYLKKAYGPDLSFKPATRPGALKVRARELQFGLRYFPVIILDSDPPAAHEVKAETAGGAQIG